MTVEELRTGWRLAGTMPAELRQALMIDRDRVGHGQVYLVVRHAARAGATWRRVASSFFEHRARQKYEREAKTLRAGILALIDPDGRAIAHTSAPWLRTRW